MISGKKRMWIVIIVILAIAGSIAILLNNKAKMQATAKINIIQTNFPVKVAQVTKEKIDDTLSYMGIINANREVSVLSETQGKITELYVDVGDYVTAGKPICKVDDEIKKAALQNAEANYEKTKKDFERFEKLYKEKSANESQLDGARLAYKIAESQYIIAKRQLNDTKITSPISGVVSSRSVELGSVLGNNTPVVYIVDISTLKVKINVPETEAFKLKTGDMVKISTDVYPGADFSGKIKSVGAKADEAHTYPVEVTLQNNTKYPLKSGMFARVLFTSVQEYESLIIPRDALVGSARNPQVYVVQNDIAKLREIKLGSEIENILVVNEGLAEGDNVVVSGQINLRNNVQVTIVK